jgi:HSP20 family molecular chaperone IbpA
MNGIMNELKRWNQFRVNQLNRLDELCGVCWPAQSRKAPQRIPLVDVSEEAEGYVIKAELPEVKKQDVQIAIEEGTLTITGDRKFDRNSKTDQPVEHAYGRFAYSFGLPADARPGKVTSMFNNGVLIIHLAKNNVIKHLRVETKGSLVATV